VIDVSGYALVYESFEPLQEGLREALCTLGNGYFASRGASPESSADHVHYPGTYAVGCYNRLRTEIEGRQLENEDLVNLPNWLPLTFRIEDGPWFDLGAVEILSFRQELNLKEALLSRCIRFRDTADRVTRLTERRLVHMREPHLAALELKIEPENWSGHLVIRSALDGRVVNDGVARYRGLNNKHLEPVSSDAIDDETVCLKVRTSQSEIQVAEAARTRLYVGRQQQRLMPSRHEEPGYIATDLEVEARERQSITIEKVVALFTSRDRAISESGLAAREAVAAAGNFEDLVHSHVRLWSHLWRRFHVEYEYETPGDRERTAFTLRLHIFHLLQTVSFNSIDLDTSVPARGLHGEAYRGHIFWDELFIFPILNLRVPEITRALLMYRYRRLGAARQLAQQAGYSGAMYPWQSGSDGREESQRFHFNPRSGRWIPDHSALQRHVPLAIAYTIWHYHQVMGDQEFLIFYGAEMFLEIARFCASHAHYNAELDRFEISGVMGPDEYHTHALGAPEPGLRNNAYTNVMAAWVLWRAQDLLNLLPEDRRLELCDMLAITEMELRQWDAISRKLRVVFHDDGVISQFEGYDQLEEFDWAAYRLKYGDIHRLDRILKAEGDDPNRYKLSKQADVLMLFYLFTAEELVTLFERLGYPFDTETIPRSISYYLERTSHGSTLSRVVHSWVLARSDRAGSWKLFTEALESDIGDIQSGTTAEGIHLGAMAGTVDLIQRCYTGIETRDDVLWLNPCLPEQLRRLKLRIRYRGHSLELEVTQDKVSISALRGTTEAVSVGFADEVHRLATGETRSFKLDGNGRPENGGSQRPQ